MKARGRTAQIHRKTKETDICVRVNMDGTGRARIRTGLGFLDHMLTLLARHSLIDINLKAKGDLHVDEHHTVEDIGICLGQAFSQALKEKRGIGRYGFTVPMDDTLAEVAIDLGGRPYLVWHARFRRERLGDLPTELLEDFFRALADNLAANIHVNVRYSRNEHHQAEAIFKALGRALRMAIRIDPAEKNRFPTTK